jgi:hypothetical protein
VRVFRLGRLIIVAALILAGGRGALAAATLCVGDAHAAARLIAASTAPGRKSLTVRGGGIFGRIT